MQPRLTFDISWRRLFWAAFGGADATPLPDAVAGLSVRTLFDAILSEAGLPSGAPVLMSGVNIQNMADLVRLHGLAPCFVDIAPSTLLPSAENLLDTQARTGAKLCLIAHLFGAHGPIESLEALRARGARVVEDLAQGFSPEALAATSQADVTLFSFGPIKRRTALGGALARFRDPRLAARVQARQVDYPMLSDGWFRGRAGKYLGLKALSHPMLYGLVFALAGRDPDAVIGKLARGFSGDDLLGNIRRRPPPRLLALLARQIAEDLALVDRRQICEAFLAGLPGGFCIGGAASSHVHWLFPLAVPDPDAFIGALRGHGFDATRGATSLRAFTGTDSYAGALMDQIIYLPHPADMDARARSRLRNATLQALTGSQRQLGRIGVDAPGAATHHGGQDQAGQRQ